MITATATLQATITATATLMAVQTGSCAAATVENSDASYSATVASGGTLILPDTTYNFYVNNVLKDTETIPSLKNETFEIYFV